MFREKAKPLVRTADFHIVAGVAEVHQDIHARDGALTDEGIGIHHAGEAARLIDGANPFGDSLFTERNWKIVDELKRIATEADQTPARIALSWVCGRPGVTSPLMGVSRPEQVSDNAAALEITLSPEHRAALDAVSTPADPRMLYSLFTPALRQHVVFGGSSVTT